MYIIPCKYQNLHFMTLIDVQLLVIFCCWQNKGLNLILKWYFNLYNKIVQWYTFCSIFALPTPLSTTLYCKLDCPRCTFCRIKTRRVIHIQKWNWSHSGMSICMYQSLAPDSTITCYLDSPNSIISFFVDTILPSSRKWK